MKYSALIIFLFLAVASPVCAQWEHLPGPYGTGYLKQNAFFHNGDTIFITVSNAIYKSSDNGHHWSFMPVNLPLDYNIQNILYKKGNLIFIEAENYYSDYSIFLSSDNGKTYTIILDSCRNISLAECKGSIYIAKESNKNSQSTLIRLNDGYKSWKDISLGKGELSQLTSFGGSLYVFYSKSFFYQNWQLSRSKDGGVTWDSLFGFHGVSADSFPQPRMFTPFVYRNNDTSLWVAVDSPTSKFNRVQHLYRLSLKGDSVQISNFPADHILDSPVASMLFYNNTLSASTGNNIYVYYLYSDSWQNITDKLPKGGKGSYFPATKNSSEYLLGQNALSRFTPHSDYSVISDTGITATTTSQIFNYLDTLFVLSSSNKPLSFSTDHGNSWEEYSFQYPYFLGTTPKGLLYTYGDTLFLRTSDTLFRSIVRGGSLLRMGGTFFCTTFDSLYRMLRSDDSGATWVKLSAIPGQNSRHSVVLKNIVFITDGNEDAYVSYDSCITWKQIHKFPYKYLRCVASKDSSIYTISEFPYSGVFNQMYESLDSAKSWIPIGPAMQDPIFLIFPYKNFLFLCGDQGIYRCNLDGSGFIKLIGDPIRDCEHIEIDSEYLYVSTGYFGIYRVKLDEVLNYVNGVSKPIIFENVKSNLYPNPSDGFITIFASEQIKKVTIFDEKGVEINLPEEKFKIEERNVKINIHSLRPGAYICRLRTALGISNQKFLKE
jgi:hypothetical protein